MNRETIQTKYLPENTILNERYRIHSVIGQGSFGITYHGFDTLLEQTVAIKEFFPKRHVHRNIFEDTGNLVLLYDDEDERDFSKTLDKFLNEARLLSQFKDIDSIVSVQDFFYGNNTAYIVMEYIDGISLKEYVNQNGAMSGEQMLSLFRPVLDALSKIHQEGLIHRDISPDNILLTKEPSLVLIDFGSVREANDESEKTLTIVFKRGFSPEEQYRNKGRQGVYSDVYALCATMYFCLTARIPDEALERIFSDDIIPLTSMPQIKLSNRQKRVIMKGISVRAKARYQNIEDLKQALFFKKSPVPFKLLFLLGVTGILAVFLRERNRTENTNSELVQTGIISGGSISDDRHSVVSTPARSVSPVSLTAASVSPTSVSVKTFSLPNVTGLKYSRAKRKLSKKPYYFKLKVVYRYDDQAAGTVIKQKPGADAKLKPKSTVTLTVSRGIQPTATPKPVSRSATKKDSDSDLDAMIH